jgi:coenzyme PQQ precursor peptide PqqA
VRSWSAGDVWRTIAVLVRGTRHLIDRLIASSACARLRGNVLESKLAQGDVTTHIEACADYRIGPPKEKQIMAWNTPTLIEICIGLEINGYLPAEL